MTSEDKPMFKFNSVHVNEKNLLCLNNRVWDHRRAYEHIYDRLGISFGLLASFGRVGRLAFGEKLFLDIREY